jgi:hypothetical protein
MKTLVVAALIAASMTLVACSDEKAPQEPLTPKSDAAVTTAVSPSPSMSLLSGPASTVCLSYEKDLVAVEAALQQTPTDADLVDTKAALGEMIADACN